MSKQEFLMLAHTFNPAKDRVGGWWLSEKLDGTRAFWDGGISRGLLATEVPYANTIKDDRLLERPIATGLWSRAGKVIKAPDWWLDELPKGLMLDGELWLGYGRFQELRSLDNWEEIRYMVFDSPSVFEMFKAREIKIRNEYSFFVRDAVEWAREHGVKKIPDWSFELRYQYLKICYPDTLAQERLPLNNDKALKEVASQLYDINIHGGEGVMLRWGSSHWSTNRSHYLLKHKPVNTMDGRIVGYTAGEGRLQGMIGALIVKLNNGKELKLSGLTDAQRNIRQNPYFELAYDNPGCRLPDDFYHYEFPKGTVVEFKYRELSDDDIPKEARFWRIK